VPIGTRPNKNWEYILESDKDLPKDEQPVFICRYISLGGSEDGLNLIVSMTSLDDDNLNAMPELIKQISGIISDNLVGWRNMNGLEFPDTKAQVKSIVRDMLSLEEAIELAGAISKQGFDSEDKKKSESPSPLDTEPSAKTAEDETSVSKSPDET